MIDDETASVIADAIGKTIRSARLCGESCCALVIDLDDGRTLRIRDAGHSCCGDRYMTCDDDLASFAGAELRAIEVRDGPEVDFRSGDVHEIQFLVVTTTLGAITVATHNEHNGYYSGFALEAELR